MDETSQPLPGGSVPARPAPTPRGRSRRWFLAGGVAVVAGAGAGVGAAYFQDRSPEPPPEPPAVLLEAAAAERALIADLAATTGGDPDVRVVVRQARANHQAHLAALDGLLAAYRRPKAPPSPRPGTPRTRAELRAAEAAAAAAAARRADGLNGPRAALLASIAACETTHAELFR